MKILIAEDDVLTREGLKDIFEEEGYDVIMAENGEKALELFKMGKPQILCLDIMMPGMNGYDVCRKVREQDPGVPVIFISAKSEEIDKVLGLEIGADDYITKPFGVKEVVARIRAVTRRYHHQKKEAQRDELFMGDLKILPGELRALRGEEIFELSLRDIKILELLHNNKGKVVSRDLLFNECWGLDYIPNSRTLDQHISQLRKKIEVDPKNPVIIRTVPTAGYRYE